MRGRREETLTPTQEGGSTHVETKTLLSEERPLKKVESGGRLGRPLSSTTSSQVFVGVCGRWKGGKTLSNSSHFGMAEREKAEFSHDSVGDWLRSEVQGRGEREGEHFSHAGARSSKAESSGGGGGGGGGGERWRRRPRRHERGRTSGRGKGWSRCLGLWEGGGKKRWCTTEGVLLCAPPGRTKGGGETEHTRTRIHSHGGREGGREKKHAGAASHVWEGEGESIILFSTSRYSLSITYSESTHTCMQNRRRRLDWTGEG